MGMYEELVNRRIQLKSTSSPNLSSSLDGALSGTSYLQTDAIPPVIWRKMRAGANGWDVEIIPPTQTSQDVYVDSYNTAPDPNGSKIHPYSTIQSALNAIGSASSQADYAKLYILHIAQGTYNESPVIPAARQIYFIIDGAAQINGNITVTVDGTLHPGPSPTGCVIGFICTVTMGYLPFNEGKAYIGGSIIFNKVNASPDTLTVVATGCYLSGAIVIPTTLVAGDLPTLFISRCVSGGIDIGGGVWKSIYAPRADVAITELTAYSEVDIRTYQCLEKSQFRYGLQLHASNIRYIAPGPTGIILSDVDGTVVTVGQNLWMDRYSRYYLEAAVKDGYATASLNHIGNLDETRQPELTVNVGSTVIVDTFTTAVGNSCVWDVYIYRGTTQARRSIIGAVWIGTTINTQGEVTLGDFGDTSSITLSIDITGGNVRLKADTTLTSSWKIRVTRRIDRAGWWY